MFLCRQADQPLSPLPCFHKSPASLRGRWSLQFIHLTHVYSSFRHAHMFHSSYTCLSTPFVLQTCCAVVFCSKDCRRKASQGYHRFTESLKLTNLLSQVWVRDETLWASAHGGEGYVWLLSCTEVALKVHLSSSSCLRLQSQGNHSEESGLLPRPPANVWGDQVHDLPWSPVLQVFIDTEEPIFPTEGIYSSGDYKALMNLVWINKNINFMYFCADHSYRRDARVNDDEERCHFGLLPSFPSTWEVLQETCAWKEKGLFWSQSLKISFSSNPTQSVSSNLLHNKQCVGKTLGNVHMWSKNQRVLKS